MASNAIALVVVGSGEVTEAEVEDLLDDAYGDLEEVGLVVPIDKDLYTDAVKFAVDWYNNDKDVFTVATKGATVARGTKNLGDPDEDVDEVEKFVDYLQPKEFAGWDEVHVLIAMPKESDDEDTYDFYADIADVALQAGFKALDLTQGLDDIVVTDAEAAEEEPEPEPEPEPVKEEKPAPNRTRSRKTTEAKKADSVEEVQEATKPVTDVHTEDETLGARVKSLESRVESLEDTLSRLATVLAGPEPKGEDKAPEEAEKPAEGEEKPKRGRGRPRTQFEVKQVWDEEDSEWIPRPAGRMRKGTQWRTIHAETNEVLDEGTA